MTELSTNCGLSKICAVAQNSSLADSLIDSGSQKKKLPHLFSGEFREMFQIATPKNIVSGFLCACGVQRWQLG